MIGALAVVVPARDEQHRVLAALGSVVASIPPRVPACVVLAADRCRDDTVGLARRIPGVLVVEGDFGSVGAARREGVRRALDALPESSAERIWIANTDADSVVPPQWLRHQLDLADAGADLVIGTVRPDFSELPDAYREHWLATHRRGEPNGHVHGANLGVRASVYARAGGFAPDAEHEDTRLVDRMLRAGARMIASDGAEVVTSGRRLGRTPGGYAGHLREHVAALDLRGAHERRAGA